MKYALNALIYAFLIGSWIVAVYVALRSKRQNRKIAKDKAELNELGEKLNFSIHSGSDNWRNEVSLERLSASLQIAFLDQVQVKLLLNSADWTCAIIDTRVDEKGRGSMPFTLFMRELAYQSPHLYFDNLNNGDAFKTELPNWLDNAQLVNFEAFVHDKFRLYAPEGYQLDSLVIGAPDFLDVLMQAGEDADIEVIGDQLYLVFPKQLDLSENVEGLIESSRQIATAIEDNLSRYRDERAVSFAEPIGYSGKRLTNH